MLHEDRMTRLRPEWALGEPPRPCAEGAKTTARVRGQGRLAMAAAVVGNTLAGGVFLGLLLTMPFILQRLLALS
jgi:hypothetical protein